MFSKKIFWIVPICVMASCGSGDAGKEDYSKTATARADATISVDSTGMATALPLNSPERKIKRTADFHCKVQNVFASVTKLEQMVKASGGIVQESQIENSNNETKTAYYKPDSLRQTQTYTTTAFLTLKVPVTQLDSLINAIPGLVSFIDSRKLKQSDVTYQYMANELKNITGETNYTAREMKLAKRSKDVLQVQEFEDNKREQKIGRKIENLQIIDDVTYATINVAFAQPEQVYVQTIVNPEYITSPPFITKCKVALNTGSNIISAIVITLISIWPLLLILAGGWIFYRRMHRKPIATVSK